MTQVTAWKASDGALFENEQDYLNHEAELELEKVLTVEDPLYGNLAGSSVDVDSIREWGIRNADLLYKLITIWRGSS